MCSDELHSIVTLLLTFTAMNRHDTAIDANHPHSFRIPSMRSKFHSSRFFPQTTALWTNSQDDVFLMPTFLTCSSLGLAVIFHTYAPKLYLLLRKPVLRVVPGPCTEWIPVQKRRGLFSRYPVFMVKATIAAYLGTILKWNVVVESHMCNGWIALNEVGWLLSIYFFFF